MMSSAKSRLERLGGHKYIPLGADSTAAHHETDQLRHQVGAGSSLLDVADPVRPNKRQRLEDNQHRRTPTFPESPKVAAIEFKNTTHLVQALQQSSDAQTVAGLFAGLLAALRDTPSGKTIQIDIGEILSALRDLQQREKHCLIFSDPIVVNTVVTYLPRKSTTTAKLVANKALLIAACNILLLTLQDSTDWPLTFCRVYLIDAFGERIWVDLEPVAKFVRNIETMFGPPAQEDAGSRSSNNPHKTDTPTAHERTAIGGVKQNGGVADAVAESAGHQAPPPRQASDPVTTEDDDEEDEGWEDEEMEDAPIAPVPLTTSSDARATGGSGGAGNASKSTADSSGAGGAGGGKGNANSSTGPGKATILVISSSDEDVDDDEWEDEEIVEGDAVKSTQLPHPRAAAAAPPMRSVLSVDAPPSDAKSQSSRSEGASRDVCAYISVCPRFSSANIKLIEELTMQYASDAITASHRQQAANFDNIVCATALACLFPKIRLLVTKELQSWISAPAPDRRGILRLLDALVKHSAGNRKEDRELLVSFLRLRPGTKSAFLAPLQNALGKMMKSNSNYPVVTLQFLATTEASDQDVNKNLLRTPALEIVLGLGGSHMSRVLGCLVQDTLTDPNANIVGLRSLVVKAAGTERFQLLWFANGVLPVREKSEFTTLEERLRERFVLVISELLSVASLTYAGTDTVMISAKGWYKAREAAGGRGSADVGVPDDVVAVKQQLSMVQNRVADWHRRDVPTFVSLSPERTQEVVRGSMFVGSAERFVGKKEEAYSESDKMKVRMVQQDLIVSQATLQALVEMGIAPNHPLPPWESLTVISELVRRAALLHTPTLPTLFIDSVKLVESLPSLSIYRPQADLPAEYNPPSLAVTLKYWQGWFAALTIAVCNPATIGASMWQGNKTMRVLMELCITRQPQQLGDGSDTALSVSAREEDTIQRTEQRQILEYETLLALTRNMPPPTAATSKILHQLCALMPPTAKCRVLSEQTLEQLFQECQLLDLGGKLCVTRQPDFLLELVQSAHSAATLHEWLPALVDGNDAVVDALPIALICSLYFAVGSTHTARGTLGDQCHRKLQTLLISDADEAPSAASVIFGYFFERLKGPSECARQTAHAMCQRLCEGLLSGDHEGAADDSAWLTDKMHQLPFFKHIRADLFDALVAALAVTHDVDLLLAGGEFVVASALGPREIALTLACVCGILHTRRQARKVLVSSVVVCSGLLQLFCAATHDPAITLGVDGAGAGERDVVQFRHKNKNSVAVATTYLLGVIYVLGRSGQAPMVSSRYTDTDTDTFVNIYAARRKVARNDLKYNSVAVDHAVGAAPPDVYMSVVRADLVHRCHAAFTALPVAQLLRLVAVRPAPLRAMVHMVSHISGRVATVNDLPTTLGLRNVRAALRSVRHCQDQCRQTHGDRHQNVVEKAAKLLVLLSAHVRSLDGTGEKHNDMNVDDAASTVTSAGATRRHAATVKPSSEFALVARLVRNLPPLDDAVSAFDNGMVQVFTDANAFSDRFLRELETMTRATMTDAATVADSLTAYRREWQRVFVAISVCSTAVPQARARYADVVAHLQQCVSLRPVVSNVQAILLYHLQDRVGLARSTLDWTAYLREATTTSIVPRIAHFARHLLRAGISGVAWVAPPSRAANGLGPLACALDDCDLFDQEAVFLQVVCAFVHPQHRSKRFLNVTGTNMGDATAMGSPDPVGNVHADVHHIVSAATSVLWRHRALARGASAAHSPHGGAARAPRSASSLGLWLDLLVYLDPGAHGAWDLALSPGASPLRPLLSASLAAGHSTTLRSHAIDAIQSAPATAPPPSVYPPPRDGPGGSGWAPDSGLDGNTRAVEREPRIALDYVAAVARHPRTWLGTRARHKGEGALVLPRDAVGHLIAQTVREMHQAATTASDNGADSDAAAVAAMQNRVALLVHILQSPTDWMAAVRTASQELDNDATSPPVPTGSHAATTGARGLLQATRRRTIADMKQLLCHQVYLLQPQYVAQDASRGGAGHDPSTTASTHAVLAMRHANAMGSSLDAVFQRTIMAMFATGPDHHPARAQACRLLLKLCLSHGTRALKYLPSIADMLVGTFDTSDVEGILIQEHDVLLQRIIDVFVVLRYDMDTDGDLHGARVVLGAEVQFLEVILASYDARLAVTVADLLAHWMDLAGINRRACTEMLLPHALVVRGVVNTYGGDMADDSVAVCTALLALIETNAPHPDEGGVPYAVSTHGPYAHEIHDLRARFGASRTMTRADATSVQLAVLHRIETIGKSNRRFPFHLVDELTECLCAGTKAVRDASYDIWKKCLSHNALVGDRVHMAWWMCLRSRDVDVVASAVEHAPGMYAVTRSSGAHVLSQLARVAATYSLNVHTQIYDILQLVAPS